MVSVSISSMKRLSLAKEMFMVGLHNSSKNTDIDRMSVILNFDFSITSIIVASCIDNNQNTKQKDGRVKRWGELIALLGTFYTNQPVITDLKILHDLRNSIQHGDVIPSDSDINRHKKIVREFFDDVCLRVYNGGITYDSISIASLLKSIHEREILLRAEKYIEERKYHLGLYLIQSAALYHYMLIKTNLALPILPLRNYPPHDVDDDNIKKVYDEIDNITDRLAMGQYYIRMKDMLNNAPPFNNFEKQKKFANIWLSQLKPLENVSLTEAENARTDIYNIMLGTEDMVTEKTIVDTPVVYGCHPTDVTQSSVRVNYGILSNLPLEECELELFYNPRYDEAIRSINLPTQNGFKDATVDGLSSNTTYYGRIWIRQNPDPEFMDSKFGSHAFFQFKTKV